MQKSLPLSTYESLNEYHMINIVVNNYPANYVFSAYKDDNPDEIWYLALRHGEYSAQVDKAVSDIFRNTIPSTPEATIVVDAPNNDFYLSSREVTHLIKTIDIDLIEHPPLYFGSVSVLSHFLAESDIHSGNMLISQQDNIISHKIDNAESLDTEILTLPLDFTIDDILDNHWSLPKEIVEHPNYANEQLAMLELIAKTPFEDFSNIILNTVTASKKEETIHFLNKLLQSPLADAENKEHLKESIKYLTENQVPELYEINDIINFLALRHEHYQKIVSEDVISNDLHETKNLPITLLSLTEWGSPPISSFAVEPVVDVI